MKKMYLSIILLTLGVVSCKSDPNTTNATQDIQSPELSIPETADTAYFAGGCFWCVEASFDQIKGVYEAISGYAGGKIQNPTYEQVASGSTEHAEAVMVIYDPEKIDYETLLDIFFTAHDPTQLNRQGPDVGKQYRSAIFYTEKKEKAIIDDKIKEIQPNYSDKIVTKVNKLNAFYPAEKYHQDYEEKNPNNPYIVKVSRPKIEKVARKFDHLLKE